MGSRIRQQPIAFDHFRDCVSKHTIHRYQLVSDINRESNSFVRSVIMFKLLIAGHSVVAIFIWILNLHGFRAAMPLQKTEY